MELWGKILVSQKFFATVHGEKACQECHGGNPDVVERLEAHKGVVKDPKAITWLLESRGITKDKKIIVTCNTGQQAVGIWFALKSLGYTNVIMHDGSWVAWERSPMMKK